MVKFLVEKGIDSISVNADAAKEISDYIKKIEEEFLGKKGELPRKYNPSDFAGLNPEGKFEKTERGREQGQKVNNEQLEQDIKAIEEEKEEYLREHPEEK